MSKQKNPFEIEKIRQKLALELKYKELMKMYSGSYAEIEDLNTPKMWDFLNVEGKQANNPMEEDRLNIVESWIKGNDVSVLNVGFGSASLEKKYFGKSFSKNTQWSGIDISPASVKKAKKEFLHGKFSVGSILDLKYKDNLFDYVVSLEVVEHIKPSDTFKALKEIYRVVKHGGYFIVSVPMNEGLEKMIARGENPNAHVRTYSPELIKAELQIVGFTTVKEKTLFAFHTMYKVKTFIAKFLLPRKFHYNNVIVVAQKPFI